jgi:predicted alpha/beta-fold hydrolase
MPLQSVAYTPTFFMRNPHVHTIVPALFRKVDFRFQKRERLELSDGDFIDIDSSCQGSKQAVILLHGLEGSSQSQYILGMAKVLYALGYDVLALNHRSCSGEMNRLPRMYHHAAYADLDEMLQGCTAGYTQLVLAGFSLGANMTIHYLAHLAGVSKHPAKDKIKAAMCFSAPLDLVEGVEEIHKPGNKVYHDRFLRSIKRKLATKQLTMPELRLHPLERIKTLAQLDDYYTAPLHGFKSGADYHRKASCFDKLGAVQIPLLLVNALDDPFLSEGCFPIALATESKHVHLQLPRYGGHVGFSSRNDVYWSEEQAIAFLKSQQLLCIQQA